MVFGNKWGGLGNFNVIFFFVIWLKMDYMLLYLYKVSDVF